MPTRRPDIVAGPPSQTLGLTDRWLRWLLRLRFGQAALRFTLGDGVDLLVPDAPSVATVRLRDRRTLLRLLAHPETAFGDAYSSRRIDVAGNFVAALEAAYRAIEVDESRPRASSLTRAHSLRASRSNVHRHYDVGNDFYRLWLDEQMVYTCAYFPDPECSLEQAQVAKMDLVCRKLRLRPGERVVEAGCGWGALALHMARHYGVSVEAYNISREQVRHARDRARGEMLAGRVEFIEDDYRHVAGRFDAFVSVGMLEHVGLENYAALSEVIDRSLDPEQGRGLLHFIGRDRARPFNAWIRRRIFPGAYPPTLSEAIEGVLEPAHVSVVAVENLRDHYAMTLARWRTRFEQSADAVRERHGDEFTRAWHLYLAGSEAAFRTGSLQLFQIVFARAGWRPGRVGSGPGRRPWRPVTP
jgi:cyclopropane-fatty-acyl-phospholipid synthase